MHFFSEDQVRKLLSPREAIDAVRAAFARDFHSTLRMPVRTQLEMDPAILLLMPSYDSALGAAGVKLVTVSPHAGVKATYALLDPTSGALLALMEANYLTDLRTAATSAVATALMARPDAQTLGILGSGRQAMAHLTVMAQTFGFKRFLVCGSGRSDIREFCRAAQQQFGTTVEPVSAETCARESDVICTCTTSPTPLFDGNRLRPGVHLNLVGAFQPHTREVDDATVQRARIAVDTYEGALAEAGDLLIPLGNGTITRSQIVAELHELASGKKQARSSSSEITLFKSVGCALEDLVVATLVYGKREEIG